MNSIENNIYYRLFHYKNVISCKAYECNILDFKRNILQNVYFLKTEHQRYVWIGGYEDTVSGEWKWVTSNQRITWADWYPGEPNDDPTERCLELNLYRQGYWNNQNCPSERVHVCEFALN